MPRIIQDNKQETALSEIVAALESIQAYNAMLQAGKEGRFALVMTPAKGRQTKVTIPASEIEALLGLCEKSRAKLVKSVNAKAAKFRIALDDEDRKCMEPLGASPVSEPSEPKVPGEPEETRSAGAEEPENIEAPNAPYPDLEADEEDEDIPLMPPS